MMVFQMGNGAQIRLDVLWLYSSEGHDAIN